MQKRPATSRTIYLIQSRTGKHDLNSTLLSYFDDFLRFFRYLSDAEDYDTMEKRASTGFGHALRIRRAEPFSHALRIRASPYGHALRIKKDNSFNNHALRIRASPYGHALRIKKGDDMYSHALRIRASPYQHALRVRRAEVSLPDFEDFSFEYPDFWKRASAFNHVLRVR